jgi:endonuclease/exonuclease/phosphatase family metal-dependent hydrolase
MKLISLNVEGSKHWTLIDPFLNSQQADVVCLQEVLEEDAARLADMLNMRSVFAPMFLRPNEGSPVYEKMGIAMLSRSSMENIMVQNYHLPDQELPKKDDTDEYTADKTIRRSLLSANINYDGKLFTVATTHFTWTPDGLPKDYQYAAAEKLLEALKELPEVILCGDFNVPRGVNDIYERFAKKYHDAIPATYASSLDLALHRAGKNPVAAERLAGYMVDYLFLSKGYRAENVRLESGVSDHCAIVATVDIAL